MKLAAVTGGTGLPGRHLVADLLEDGRRVRVLSRDPGRAREVLPGDAEIVEGDVADPSTAPRLLDGVDEVFHLAALFTEAGVPDERYREVNVEGTRHLLDAAEAEDIGRFVHCSTVGVLSHVENPPADESSPHAPGDIYQQTKLEGELLALAFQRRHDLPLSVVRPAPIYGPGGMRLLKMFRLIQKGMFPILGDGKPCFHMVYVTDLVRGFRLAAERDEAVGEVFIIGGPDYYSLNELTAMIAEELQVDPPRLHLPYAPFYWLGAAVESVCIPLGIEPPIFRRRVAFFANNRAFSIRKARERLGYEPEVDTREGLRRTIDWYRGEGLLE